MSRAVFIERFLAKTKTYNGDPEKCWHWQGASKGNGYGMFQMGKVKTTAHRAAYVLLKDCRIELTPDDDVCHTCDVRFCVNPNHLFLANRKENMRDAAAKKRLGGFHGVRIKESVRQEVLRRVFAGQKPATIMEAMNISVADFNQIKRGEYARY
jgi:hypothetical protein